MSGLAPTAAAPRLTRIGGLDGIRGLAALFVVLNHIFERSWPGRAAEHAPWWASELIYGRFAVIMFIALSGFSLALGPARSGWRFDSLAAFARRRAWRILPPYWAALAFSLVMTWHVQAQPGRPVPDGESVLVHGLLIQDVFSVSSPNRAFWSIAVEAQLYLLLPLLLLTIRRLNPAAMIALVAGPVLTLGVLGPNVAMADTLLAKLTPDLAVLFAVGVLAAGVVTASERIRTLPWTGYALASAIPVVVLISAKGQAWSTTHLFWVDLAWAPAIGCLLAAIATSRPRRLLRALDAAPLRSLGSFSYSLYLVHMPIVIAVSYGFVLARIPSGTPTFLLLTAVLLPLTLAFARLFAAALELPFQRYRGWTPLWRATRHGLSRVATPGPARLLGHERELAHPTAGQPVAPQLMGVDQVGHRPRPEPVREPSRGRTKRAQERLRRRQVRSGGLLLPGHGQPRSAQQDHQLGHLDQPHRVSVWHARSFARSERSTLLDREREPAPGLQDPGHLLEQRLLVAEGQQGLEQQHHLEPPVGQRRHAALLEAAGQLCSQLPSDLQGTGGVVHTEVVAAQFRGDHSTRAGHAATDVEDADTGADRGSIRESPDLLRPHEALLPDVLTGRVGSRPGPLQCRHERRAIVLSHHRVLTIVGPGRVGTLSVVAHRPLNTRPP